MKLIKLTPDDDDKAAVWYDADRIGAFYEVPGRFGSVRTQIEFAGWLVPAASGGMHPRVLRVRERAEAVAELVRAAGPS